MSRPVGAHNAVQLSASLHYAPNRTRRPFPRKVIAVFAIAVGVLLAGLIAGVRI